MWSWIILIAVVVLLAGGIGIYNGLVQSRLKVKEAFSTIDVYLKNILE